MEHGDNPLPLIQEVSKEKNSQYITPILMLLGVITATLSIIIAGYIHGNMHLLTVIKNATSS